MVRYGQDSPDQAPNGGVDVEDHLLDLITHQGYTDDDVRSSFLAQCCLHESNTICEKSEKIPS